MLALLVALAFPALAVDAPVSLTASDGSGLALTGYEVDTVITGPLAFTELRLAFDNPQDRIIEGRFRLLLPDGAAVSRFAMKIDGQFQEGEVVEKQAARRAYEDALHRRQDPALLEQASPNEFSARVFPIPARGRKEIIVSWSQELPSSTAPWRLALQGLPEIGSFKARVRHGGREVFAQQKVRYVPVGDVVIAASPSSVLRSQDVVVARVKPVATSVPVNLGGTLVLLDTSASRGLGEGSDRALVTALVERLQQDQPGLSSQPLSVLAFDQVAAPLFTGTFGDFAKGRLAPRRALGASDLGHGLAAAADVVKARGLSRVVVVSDGLLTSGLDGDALVQQVKGLGAAGVTRIDAIAVGGLRDEALLRRLVVSTLRDEGAVVDSGRGIVEVARRLRLKAMSGLKVDVAGATWVWPKTLDGVQPGDEVLVVAELPAPVRAVEVRVAGVVVDVGAVDSSVPAPLLRRAWARARIARLLDAREREQDQKARAELAEQIVTVSVTHRVLSPLTALIVLETEADYARFGIDRKALADVLVVDDSGLRLLKRSAIVVPPAPKPVAEPRRQKPSTETKKMSRSREGEAEGAAAKSMAADGDAMKAADSPADDVADDEENERAPGANEERRDAAPSPPPPPPPSMSAPAPAPAAAPSSRSVDAVGFVARGEAVAAESDQMPEPESAKVYPYTGPFADVMKLLDAKKVDEAVRKARGWREEDKGDLLALLALGEALERSGDLMEAGRAYGSLVDLFADRADIRRLAGARLDRLAGKTGAGSVDAARVAEDTWRRAALDRPDHPQGPRGQAWALVRLQRFAEAFDIINAARKRGLTGGRFGGVDEILNDDLGLIAAAWAKAEPTRDKAIQQRLQAETVAWPHGPSLRFVLWWETDANDVDFHIHDGKRNHAYYSTRELPTGGRLYADVTTGFGPECFTIEGKPTAYPYRLEAHYYSRGPMGFGMGAMRVMQHDGHGGIVVEDRPFIIMVDGAFVDLGTVTGPLP
jgi:hypothetical protein